MYSALRAAYRPSLRRVMATQATAVRSLATSQPIHNGSADGASTPRATAKKQLLTLSEIDRLLTHVSRESQNY